MAFCPSVSVHLTRFDSIAAARAMAIAVMLQTAAVAARRPTALQQACVRSFHRSVGIVGMPNVGKSTLFNALTKTENAQAANYPFCTIDPNVARVAVPDERVHHLAKLEKSQRVVETQVCSCICLYVDVLQS